MSSEDTEAGANAPADSGRSPQGEAPQSEAPQSEGSAGGGRKRVRRRRKKSAASKPKASAELGREAGAFLEPPPLEKAAVEKKGEKKKVAAKRKRKTRRRRAPTAPTEDQAAEAAASAAPESQDGEDRAPRKKARRKRKRSSRGRGRQTALDEQGDGATPDGVPPLPEDEGPPPQGGSGAAPAGAEARKGRAPRERKSRSGRGETSRGETSRGESRRGGSRQAKSEGQRDRKGRKEGGREGRRRDGRRSEGRRSEGRRRDPRAIDIVPRAPTAEDAAREIILLVNATDREEARIALLVDGRLEEVYVESTTATRSSAGNIYRGRVQNVERGIGAAFVDLGRGLTGFLHASDLPVTEGEDPRASVTERLHPGDEVIVQITRDSIGRKGPALTGRISFPGRYLVLMPFTARSGISRRIPQGSERERVRKLLRKLDVPEGMGVIVRTASESTDLPALEADLSHLLSEWELIKRKAAEPGQPGQLRGESDLAERSVRDIMPSEVTRIVVDKDELAGQIHRLLRIWYPSAAAAGEQLSHMAVRSATAALDAPLGELRAQEVAEKTAQGGKNAAGALEQELESGADEPAVEGSFAEGLESESVESESVNGEPLNGEPGEGEDDAEAGADDGGGLEDIQDIQDVEDIDDMEEIEDGPSEPEEELPEQSPEEQRAHLVRTAQAMPEVELHTDAVPLFHKYGVETQLEDAFRRTIRLPAGGSIVIDPTEALVAVDVNSGRLTDEEDPESTALITNLEAVTETARQLRVRDLGGLVVIDFIDMRDRRSRKKVELALRDVLSADRARIRMGRMGPFGLVVLSRQRIRQALSRVTHELCPECSGTGNRRMVSGLGLRVLREMEARVARSRGRGGLEVRAPKEVVAWIRKNRSGALKRLRKGSSGPITVEVDARLASDGWAMKGLPPTPGGEEAEES